MKNGEKITYFLADLTLSTMVKVLIEHFDYKLGGNNVEEAASGLIVSLLWLHVD